MAEYTGDVVLLVNVASKWGLTKQNYQELPQLSDEYSSQGLTILAFPCNQFGAQEPGTNEEILEFVKRYDADMAGKLTFFDKADVNGANTREVYSYVKPLAPNSDGTLDIRWNFGTLLLCYLAFSKRKRKANHLNKNSLCFWKSQISGGPRGQYIQEVWSKDSPVWHERWHWNAAEEEEWCIVNLKPWFTFLPKCTYYCFCIPFVGIMIRFLSWWQCTSLHLKYFNTSINVARW